MISEIIAAYLKDQLPAEREYAPGTYYPGELPFCLRAQYFRYTQPAKALGPDRENLFGVGLLWQACVEEALVGSKIEILESRKIRKLKVPDSSLVLLCEPDFVVNVDAKKLVVELKTAASLAKFSEPMREHVLQLTAYMQVTKTADALIVYLNKQTGEVKEFPVHLEPENLLLLFERARRLDQALQDRALPARVGAGQEWQCKNCEFVTECETFQGDSMTEHRTVWVDRVKIDATSKNLEETDLYLLVKNVVLSRQGIFAYDQGKFFKPADELKAGAWTLEGAWIVAYQHPESFVFDRDDIRGRSVNIRFDEDKAALVGDLRFEKRLCDKALLDGIRSGQLREVSPGFSSFDKRLPGTFGDETYTFVQTRYLFNHVAVALTEGRCPAPFCGIALDSVLDSANFVEVKICESAQGAFPPRVITWSEKEGILAAVGKRDPAGDAEVLRYLFSKAKGWTLEKAEAWTKGHKDAAAQELSEKELRARIEDLEKKRQEILDKMYPPPLRLPQAEERMLQLELTLIDGQVHALTEVLAEKLAGVEPSGSAGDSADKGKKLGFDPAHVDPSRVIVAKPAGPEPPTPGAKPCRCPLIVAREEVERARRLLGSR